MTGVVRHFRSRGILAAVALVLAWPSLAQSLPEGVPACLTRLEAQPAPTSSTAQVPKLGDFCPELAAEIDDTAWGVALADIWAEDLSTRAFRELVTLVSAYDAAVAEAPSISVSSLDAALREIEAQEPVVEPSLWDRIAQWFDERFGSRGGAASNWLEDWLEDLSVPERIVRYVVIALGFVVVIATVAIVVNELRVAGVLAGGALRQRLPGASEAEAGARVGLSLDGVLGAPLAQRPALLLKLVLDRLRARGAMIVTDSLTHREILSAMGGLREAQREDLGAIIAAAERATFGGWSPAEPEFAGVAAHGRALLASLSDTGQQA